MHTRTQTLAILLVLVSIVAIPAAVAQQGATGTASAPPPGEAPDGAAGGTDRAAENYTRLSVQVDEGYPDLKPGERETVTVTVTNLDEEAVTLDPSVEHPPRATDLLPGAWLSFDGGEVTVDPDQEVAFNVTVSVPDDADLGRYHGVIAVTDERIQQPGRPASPLHAATLGVNVFRDPTVHVLSRTHLHGQIEAGTAATAEITVENTGEESVPVNPEVGSEERHRVRPRADGVLDPAWIAVDAPAEIAPGERATIEVTVSPPADADVGNYRTQLDLGLRDPARPEGDDYWQRIGVDVNVWSQPDDPYVREFDVDASTDAVELRLTQRSGYGSSVFGDDREPGSFNVTLASPDGERISPERVRLTDRGSVDLIGNRRPAALEDSYAAGSAAREYVYRIENPSSGTWSAEIEPENTIGFEYEIVRK